MLSQQDENTIFRALNEILDNLELLNTQDVANFLVENDPVLAGRLSDAINFTFLDKDIEDGLNNTQGTDFGR